MAMVKILKFVLILMGILTVLALIIGWVHGIRFDNWWASAAFFYAGEGIGAIITFLIILLIK